MKRLARILAGLMLVACAFTTEAGFVPRLRPCPLAAAAVWIGFDRGAFPVRSSAESGDGAAAAARRRRLAPTVAIDPPWKIDERDASAVERTFIALSRARRDGSAGPRRRDPRAALGYAFQGRDCQASLAR